MSIQSEITRIENNIAKAYSAVEEMGADIPEEANSDNLPSAIRAIPKANIVQSTGDSESDIMSQKATTDELNKKLGKENKEDVASAVKAALAVENWTFELEDGTIVTKAVLLV